MANPHNNTSYYSVQDALNRALDANNGALVVESTTGGGGSSTAVTTSVTSTGGTSSVPLKAANTNRKGLIIRNTDPSQTLYLGLGVAATPTSGSVAIAPGGYYELPATNFTGQVNGCWSAVGTNPAIVTELT